MYIVIDSLQIIVIIEFIYSVKNGDSVLVLKYMFPLNVCGTCSPKT